MKLNSIFGIALLVLGCALFSSCKKDETPLTTNNDNNDNDVTKKYSITANVVLANVWEEYTSQRKNNNPVFMCYLFSQGDTCLQNRGNFVSNTMQTTFENATTTGSHTIYSVVGWSSDEYPRCSLTTITRSTLLPIPDERVVYLGKQDFTIVDSTISYMVPVSVNPIMSKLRLLIQSVPTYIDSILIVLPNQANNFLFDGTTVGNSKKHEFALTKDNPNSNGGFDWKLNDTIVFPSATVAESMPIMVISVVDEVRDTINTISNICCRSNSTTSLRTRWEVFYTTANITINPWSDTVYEGEFEL